MRSKGLPISPEMVHNNYSYLGSYNVSGKAPATLFVAVHPSVSASQEGWSVLNCSLWNSTYDVNFNFSSGVRQTTVTRTRDKHPVGVEWLENVTSTAQFDPVRYGPVLNYQAVMECLGKLLVGSVYKELAYGHIYETGSALQTDLAYTKELFPVYNSTINTTMTYNKAVLDARNSQHYQRPLAGVIEEMFQNMTMALLSKNTFLGHATVDTNVTVQATANTYVYSPRNLVLSYCFAIVFSFVTVVPGLVSLWNGGSSYSNKFSTTMRTTCGPALSRLLEDQDMTGADPLREELGNQKIQVGTDMAGSADNERPWNTAERKSSLATNESSSMLTIESSEAVEAGGQRPSP
jgi:hypothetical protein